MILEISEPNSSNRTPAREVDGKHAVLFLEDVADILRMSRSTIERRRRNGTFPIPELPSIDRRPRWSRTEVERFVEEGGRTPAGRGRPRTNDRAVRK